MSGYEWLFAGGMLAVIAIVWRMLTRRLRHPIDDRLDAMHASTPAIQGAGRIGLADSAPMAAWGGGRAGKHDAGSDAEGGDAD